MELIHYDSRIPHILHQTWRLRAVPRGFHAYIRSWQQLQPTWRYVLHTDADNNALVEDEYRWLRQKYYRFSSIQRADLVRYIYMHRWGGVYADLDVGLLKPLCASNPI